VEGVMSKRKKNRITLKGAQVWVEDASPNPSTIASQYLKGSNIFPKEIAKHAWNFGPKTLEALMKKHKTMGKIHMLLVSNNKKAFAGIRGLGPVAYHDLFHLVPDYFRHVQNNGDPFKFTPHNFPPNPWKNRTATPEKQERYEEEKKNFYPYKAPVRGKYKTKAKATPPPVVVEPTTPSPPSEPKAGVSDGSTASYYELPDKATELQHLIMYKDMNSQMGEIFRACYRYGQASHSDKLRDAKKIKFYIEAEIERLEKWT
tara:strand:+ start:89 stop:865 length:777 start_codon:yes stop_codon:yes gene_type:complete